MNTYRVTYWNYGDSVCTVDIDAETAQAASDAVKSNPALICAQVKDVTLVILGEK